MQDKEVVALIKAEYPKYDKYLHSKVKKPLEYGIRLLEEAEKLITTTEPQKPHRADRHRIRCKVSCRLKERKKKRLQLALKKHGYFNMQDGLNYIIDLFLGE